MGKYYEPQFSVLKITGAYEKLMNGVASNTLDASRNAFLDIYGKIVAVFYQFHSREGLFIVIPSQLRDRLETHLRRYLTLGKAKLEPTGLKAFILYSQDEDEVSGHKIRDRGCTVLLSENPPEGFWIMDEDEFEELRFEKGISVQGREFDSEMIMNTDWSDAVSFHKGCFLGQEIVAKIEHLGRPPRKMVRVAFEKEPGKAILQGNHLIEVRSKHFSKKRGKWIAFCSVPNDVARIDGGEIL